MEATAFYSTHIYVALIHEGFYKECQCFTAGPKRWITADMRPERFHELDTTADICNDLR